MTDAERIKNYIDSVKWKFAKSMPKSPHEYTVKTWDPEKENEFIWFVLFIRENGYKKKYGSVVYTYYNFDGWQYWTMGNEIKITILINRAALKTI